MKRLLLIFILLCFGVWPARAQMPSLANDLVYLPDTFSFAGKHVPLDRWFVRDKLERTVRYYVGSFKMRERMNSYIVASARYFPYLDSVLTANGLSRDLKYIPVIESELNCSARSKVSAVGCWQIMAATGRRLRLRVNRFVDERRDFVKSTLAAIAYIKNSQRRFHDYFLTVAAYNAGDGAIANAMRENDDSEYVNLIILKQDGTYNTETMDYLYLLWAVKIVMENPERYGFPAYALSGIETEIVDYNVARQTTIIELARHFGIAPKEFLSLNPVFVSPIILRGSYPITIPRRNP